ncbi:MAG: class I SAM-dependent methyltransferase [Candidatus Acidiferrum sp.]
MKNGFYVFDESELVNSLDYHLDKAKLDIECEELLNKLGRYLIPNLGSIKGSRILSVGCGAGSDIEKLNDLGAEAYGMDFAYRTEGWKARGVAPAKHYLFVSSAARIPFPVEFFDVILCMGVIEHVAEQLASRKEYAKLDGQRGLFLNALFGVLKPGGTLIITSPNRNFPIDFQHNAYGSPKVLAKFSVYTHSPFTRFLESYYSLSRHFERIGKHKAEPMPLVNFFGFNVFRLSSRLSGFKRIFETYIQALDNCPQFVRRSFLNPYVVLKIVKESARC